MSAEVNICETCLSYGRKMLDIDADQLQSICPGFQISVRNNKVCWECRSMVHKWVKFRDRVVKAQELLADFSIGESYTSLSNLGTKTQDAISIDSSVDPQWMKAEDNPFLTDPTSFDVKVEPETDFDNGPLDSPFVEEQIVCEDYNKSSLKTRKISITPLRVFVKEDIGTAKRSKTKKKQQNKSKKTKKTKAKVKNKVTKQPNVNDQSKDSKLPKTNIKDELKTNNSSEWNAGHSSEETDTADEFEDETSKVADNKMIFRTVRVEREKLLRLMHRTRKKRRFLQSRLLKCNSCIILFKSEQLYQQHIRRHEETAGPYTCELCQLRFKTPEYVRIHEETHFDKCIECVECRELFVVPWDFSSHYNDYHAYRDIMCWKCIMMFSTMQEYRLHRNKVHRGRLRLACDACGKTLGSKHTLLNHIKKFHSATRVTTKCPLCPRVLKGDWRHLQRHHMKLHAPREEKMKNENSFCVECDAQYATEAIYKKHVKEKHEGETRSECPECGKLFRNLKSHMDSTHSTELKYSCPECNKKFKTNYSKNYHLRFSHHNMPKPRNKVCPKCNKAFGCKRQLEDHMNGHTGLRPHVCADCGATFGHRSALFTHTRLKHRPRT